METEGTVNWTKLWTLVNSMIKSYPDDPSARCGPNGWVCDERGGLWGGIKQVFGEDAVKKTVSCEFHDNSV